MEGFRHLTFTPAVKAIQSKQGSRATYERLEREDYEADVFGPHERAFLAERDSFYLASVGSNGWPYVQHRGGPEGFVRVLDDHTLGFADYRGNKQYISVGNVGGDDRVALIFVDYPARTRLKILAHARLVTGGTDEERALLEKLAVPGYKAKVERGFILDVEGFDWNCPQHITPRYTEEQVHEHVRPMEEELATLRAENEKLRRQLATR